MKHIRISYFVLLFSLMVSGIAPMYADYYNDDCCQTDCCATSCCEPVYDCGDPLNPCSVDLAFFAGVAPSIWTNRGNFSLISCNALSLVPPATDTVVPLFEIPRFNQLFHVPWIVGGWIGYAITCNLEVFLQVDYRQASVRSPFVLNNISIPGNQTLNATLTLNNSYRAFDAFVGARYYWGRCWCDRIAFFVGGQFGLVHRKEIDFSYVITNPTCPGSAPLTVSNVALFLRNTVPAVGFNIGVDWCFGCGWSGFIMVDFIGSCGPRSNTFNTGLNVVSCGQLPILLPSDAVIGGIGSEVFFPVAVGVRYSF
jgi:hypothetical protein